MQTVRYILLCLLAFLTLPIASQTQEAPAAAVQDEQEVRDRMMDYVDELNMLVAAGSAKVRFSDANRLSGSFVRILNDKLHMMNSDLHSIELRWKTFIQVEQATIANSEELMEQMAQVELLKKAVADTIASQQRCADAVADFTAAEHLILSQDSIYKQLYKKAFKLSLIKKLAPQLEKVKAEEEIRFSQIDASYSKVKSAIETFPELVKYSAKMEDRYISLKAVSEKIQTMEYKPFIQRIKDELMGLACVAIILLFFNFMVSKVKTAMKLRETLKKQQELLKNTNGTGYPTI